MRHVCTNNISNHVIYALSPENLKRLMKNRSHDPCLMCGMCPNEKPVINSMLVQRNYDVDIAYKKLSYCCDSRSYCMQKYDRLKQLLRDTLSILTPRLTYIVYSL